MSAVFDLPGDQRCDEIQIRVVAGQPSPSVTNDGPETRGNTSRMATALLSIYADNLDGFERLRIDTQNRLRSIMLHKGGDGTSPEEQRLQATVDTLCSLEHGAELELKRALRLHPLGGWVKRTVGIGEKQGARLLAAIGDPYWNAAADRPRRGPAELWAFCGYHVLHPGQAKPEAQKLLAGVDVSHASDHRPAEPQEPTVAGVAPRRQRGQRANWNGVARMRTRLIAESCRAQRHSPYRAIYDTGRAKYAEAVHQHSCAQCGPSGKPAPIGSPLSDGHKDARALRLVAKEILKDLFLEGRRLHLEASAIALDLEPPPGLGSGTAGGSGSSGTANATVHELPVVSRGAEPSAAAVP